MVETGISYSDGKKVESVEIEFMKLRRFFRGKEKEMRIFQRMYEKQAESEWGDKEYDGNEAAKRRTEANKWGYFADCIDDILVSVGVEILPKYLLKSELKAGKQTLRVVA